MVGSWRFCKGLYQFCLDIFVSIGCFNGNVHLLIVGGAARSFAYTDSQPRPVIDSNDNIPVIEMTWEKISKPVMYLK